MAFSTLLQPSGAANSTWKELEVAMKILLMLKEPFGVAHWKEKQRQGSSEGSILETPKEEDMGFMMGKIQGCLQSRFAMDGLQTHMEHVRLWHSTLRTGIEAAPTNKSNTTLKKQSSKITDPSPKLLLFSVFLRRA
ncbi:unnamed protein product [Bubo scandiacus]